jgi:hypothetical protein
MSNCIDIIAIDLKIRPERLEEFKKILETLKSKKSENLRNSLEKYLVEFVSEYEGYIFLKEPLTSNYFDEFEDFIKFIYKFIEIHCEISFDETGASDNSRWGYYFEEDGIYEMDFYKPTKGKLLFASENLKGGKNC